MRLQMWDALEEYCFMSQCDVIEEHQVLVNLSHVAHVRNHLQARTFAPVS